MGALANAGVAALASMFVGVLPLAMAVVYAIWPNEQRLTLIRPLSLATVFAAVAGLALGFANELRFISRTGQVAFSARHRGRPCRRPGACVLRVRVPHAHLAVRDHRAVAASVT